MNSRRVIKIISFTLFLNMVGFGIIVPILPEYAQHFGANGFMVGVLIAVYSLAQFIFVPWMGRLSDRIGRRPVLLITLVGAIVSWILFGIARSLAMLFVARFVLGAMAGNVAPAQAVITDITTKETRTRGLGMVGLSTSLGMILGPVIGGIFASPNVVAAFQGAFPFKINQFILPSLVAALLSTVNLVVGYFMLPETKDPSVEAKSKEDRLTLKKALKRDHMKTLIVLFLLFMSAFSVLESIFVLLTENQFGFSVLANGMLLGFLGIMAAISQSSLINKLTGRFGLIDTSEIGAAIMAAGMVILPFSLRLGRMLGIEHLVFQWLTPGIIILLFSLVLIGLGNGLLNTAIPSMVSYIAGEDEQGGALGVTRSAGSLARTVGPTVAGAMWTYVAFWSPFVAGALVLLPVIFLLYVNDPKRTGKSV
ncbi:MAG: MFS transporter [Halobacteria archaeon]